LQLIDALQKAGKSIEVQLAPDGGHTALNRERMMEFFIKHLVMKINCIWLFITLIRNFYFPRFKIQSMSIKRRDFIRVSAVGAGAAALLAGCSNTRCRNQIIQSFG
jgi:hypothetical protein